MNLSFTQAKVCAYLFDLDLDPRYESRVMLVVYKHECSCNYVLMLLSITLMMLYFSEMIFGVGNNVGTRRDFESLLPGRTISTQVSIEYISVMIIKFSFIVVQKLRNYTVFSYN